MACNGCSGQELALSKLQGPVGPTGPTGATGPAGATLVHSVTDVTSAAGNSTTPLAPYSLLAGTLSDGEGFRLFAQYEVTGSVTTSDLLYPTVDGGGIQPNYGILPGAKHIVIQLEAIRTSATNFKVTQTITYFDALWQHLGAPSPTISPGNMGSIDMDLNDVAIGFVASTTNASAATLRLGTIQLLTL